MMSVKSFICLLMLLLGYIVSALSSDITGPVVTLKYGDVMGQNLKSYENNDYYAFKAIPYAKAPTGERRFKVSFAVLFATK